MVVRLAEAHARRRAVTRAAQDDFSSIEAVLFDLDGTLVDSESQVAAGAVEMFANFGHEVTKEEILAGLGPPLVDLIMDLTDVDLDEAKRMYQEYLRIYAEKYIPRTPPMPGAVPLLDALADRGLPLAIVTNKVEEAGRAVVEVLGWEERFRTVVGNDTAPRPKPHPDPALHALNAVGVAPEAAVFVGDSPADMGCATSAGLRAAIALPGYAGEERMRAAGATHYCPDLRALHALLQGL